MALVCRVQEPSTASQAEIGALFNHFVGAGQQRSWYGDAERLGCLEIDGEFEFRRLLDWPIGSFFVFENFFDVRAATAETSRQIRTEGGESPGFGG